MKKKGIIFAVLGVILCIALGVGGIVIKNAIDEKRAEEERKEAELAEQNALKKVIFDASEKVLNDVKNLSIKNYTYEIVRNDDGSSYSKSTLKYYVDVKNKIIQTYGEDVLEDGNSAVLNEYKKVNGTSVTKYVKQFDWDLFDYIWKKQSENISESYAERMFLIYFRDMESVNEIKKVTELTSDLEGAKKYEVVFSEGNIDFEYYGTVTGDETRIFYIQDGYIIKSIVDYTKFIEKDGVETNTEIITLTNINKTKVTLPTKNIR